MNSNNKKSLLSKEKNVKNKRPIKITFSKAKTVKTSLTFSEITKMTKVHFHVFKNRQSKKYQKASIVKLYERHSNEKYLNEGIQFSNKYYGNDKSLLLGGTQTRKRKRVDYVKLNNSGFDICCSQKKLNEENHSVQSRTEKIISISMSNPKKDGDKGD